MFVVWETFDTSKLRIHSCKCVFSIISLPLHLMYLDAQTYSGPNKVFVVREWNVFVELAQGSYLTFTHFRSTLKHVMGMVGMIQL